MVLSTQDRNILKKDPRVKGIRTETTDLGRKRIIIDTVPLYLYNNRRTKRTPLGRFRIKIPAGDRFVGLPTITQLDNKFERRTRVHPHYPCIGGADLPIRSALNRKDILTAFEILMKILSSYSGADDAGKLAYKWFEQHTEEKQQDGTWKRTK